MSVVIADRNPSPVTAGAHAIRQVDPLPEQHLALDDGAAGGAVHRVPADRIAVIVADQQMTQTALAAHDRNRAGRVHDRSASRLQHLDRREIAVVGGRHLEDGDTAFAVGHDNRFVIQEIHAMGVAQRRR
jgi:hypothetical protein